MSPHPQRLARPGRRQSSAGVVCPQDSWPWRGGQGPRHGRAPGVEVVSHLELQVNVENHNLTKSCFCKVTM